MVDAVLLVFQAKEHAALIGGIAERRHGVHDVGIEAHNIGHPLLQLHHVLKCNSLLRFGKREHQALVFVGNKSRLRDGVQIKRQPDQAERHHQGGELVPQHPLEAAVITAQPGIENPLAQIEQPSMLRPLLVTEEAAAQHRSQGQRYESRNQNRGPDGDREFMQQTSDDSAHEQQRNKDGGQRQRHGENGEANLAGAIPRGLQRPFPRLHVANNVLQHDDGVVHHKSHRQGQCHQGKVVQTVAQQVHDRKRPNDGHGQSQRRNDGGGYVSQEDEDHHDDQSDGQQQGELDVVDRGANGDRAVIQRVDFDRRRNMLFQPGQQLVNAVYDGNRVGPRLLLNCQNDGPSPVKPTRGLVVLHTVNHPAKIAQADRGTVPIGHHHGRELQSIHALPVGQNGERMVLSIKGAGGKVGISRLQGGADFVDPYLTRSQSAGIDLRPHGILLRSIHHHLRHPVHHGDVLRDGGLGGLVDVGQLHRRRTQRQIQDGRIGRIYFLESRRRRHLGRQLPPGGGDGCLDVQGGAIEVAAKVELNGDAGLPEGIRRRHRINAGDGGELFFQRGGHRRSHGVGTCARKRSAHQNGGKVHVRQVADGQQLISEDPEDQNRGHDQRGHNGPLDEDLGDAHSPPPAAPLAADESVWVAGKRLCTTTFALGATPNWPFTITCSPAFNPPAIRVRF